MRFFTPQWRDGELSDDEFENAPVLYNRRLDEIRGLLPSAIVRMLRQVSIHDGQVQFAEADRSGTFRLLLRAGDLQRGYVDVELTYTKVQGLEGVPSVGDVLNFDGEIVRDEIDIDERSGTLEHRLLFAPEGELTVRFGDLEFVVTPVEHREFKRPDRVFVDRRAKNDGDRSSKFRAPYSREH